MNYIFVAAVKNINSLSKKGKNAMSNPRFFIPEKLKQDFEFYRKNELIKACFFGALAFFTFFPATIEKQSCKFTITTFASLGASFYSLAKYICDFTMIVDGLDQESLEGLKAFNYEDRKQALKPRY